VTAEHLNPGKGETQCPTDHLAQSRPNRRAGGRFVAFRRSLHGDNISLDMSLFEGVLNDQLLYNHIPEERGGPASD